MFKLPKWLNKFLSRKDEDVYRILVDREGVAYLPTREIKLQAKKKDNK